MSNFIQINIIYYLINTLIFLCIILYYKSLKLKLFLKKINDKMKLKNLIVDEVINI